jgi:nickel-dependent lactate racemase
MKVDFRYGGQHIEFAVPDERVLACSPSDSSDLDNPDQVLHDVLEHPVDFPSLRRALTPDDNVVIVIDESIPQLARFLTPILEHLLSAHVKPEAITLLCLTPSTSQPWLDDLPEAFLDVRIEIHDPKDRKHLSYLATTKKGRRVYLNRTLVDADQTVIFTRRSFDPLFGYTGGETDLFPGLTDEATQTEFARGLHLKPQNADADMREQATEVAWLLGMPFFVQIIEGNDAELSHVLGGTVESNVEGLRLWKNRWKVRVPERADVVVAGIGKVDDAHSFAEMARALVNASKVVKSEGKIVLLTEANPDVDAVLPLLQKAGELGGVLDEIQEDESFPDRDTVFCWAKAASRGRIYLLSQLPEETVEDLGAVYLQNAAQVQRLLDANESCVFLPEANKTLAVLKNGR